MMTTNDVAAIANSIAHLAHAGDSGTKPTMAAIGRYMHSWRREDGTWLVSRREILVG